MDSEKLKAEITMLIATYYPQLSIKVVYNYFEKIANFFNLKQRMPLNLQANINYKYTCGGCNDTYIDSTAKTYGFRMSQHLGISLVTSELAQYQVKMAT